MLVDTEDYAVDGRPQSDVHVMSLDELPFPPLPNVLAAAGQALGSMNRVPDRACAELIGELADQLGVPEGCLLVGVEDLLAAAVVLAHDAVVTRVGCAWPYRPELVRSNRLPGVQLIRLPAGDDSVPDLAAAGDAVAMCDTIFIANPHSPTGAVVDADGMHALLRRIPLNTTVVLDETLRDFVRDPAVPDGIQLHRLYPNVVVLRSLSVAHGLAGAKIGYLVAQPSKIAALHGVAALGVPDRVAQAAAVAALRSPIPLRARINTVLRRRRELVAGLRSTGLRVADGAANFVWLPLGAASLSFAMACRRAGVEVRVYDGRGVRVTVGEPAANQAILRAAVAFAGSHPAGHLLVSAGG